MPATTLMLPIGNMGQILSGKLPRLDTPEMVPYAAPVRAAGGTRVVYGADLRTTNHEQGETTMAHAVKGVIAGAKGAPVQVETILVPDPGPGEALVRVKACG